MPTNNQIIESIAIPIFERVQSDWILHPEVAARYAVIDAVMRHFYQSEAPDILSGFRSLDAQRRLHLAGRPAARRSWHTVARAIDVDKNSPNLQLFGELWELTGGRWGKRFTKPDINHFDFPGAVQPEPAF
jgi:hypothetical protein